MSKEFHYDPESGSFRANSGDWQPQPPKKKNTGSDIGWGLIVFMFVVWWPIGLALLIAKLYDAPAKKPAKKPVQQGTSTSARKGAKTKSKAAKTVKNMNRAPAPTDKTAKTLTVIGTIVAAIFGIGFLSTIGEIIGYGWYSYMAEELFSTGGFLAGGLAMLFAGRRMKRRSKRIAHYMAAMGERSYISVDELCAVSGKKRRTVESDLAYMMDKGLLETGAYLDSGRGIFFRSADAFAAYADEKRARENVTPKEANEGYAGALRAIRHANDRIADPVLSEKIDHLEAVAGRIFREVEAHPEKQQQAATFLNYYLPTTLKLLDSYAKFEEAGIEGENLTRAQERIEETMDALVKGFDKQLDDLYRSEAMDIDTDIRVMENMLRRDTASAADDFGLGGMAAQRAADEE